MAINYEFKQHYIHTYLLELGLVIYGAYKVSPYSWSRLKY